MLRKITALILTAVLLLAAAVPALAATDAEISAVKDFKFFHFENGIGRGLCPVYTAPDADAFRIDGAQCQTNADMSVAGVDAAGWLLVRYTTNDGAERIGWIPPEYAKAFKMDGLDYVRESLTGRVACTAQADLAVTDDLMGASTFATIPAGETYAKELEGPASIKGVTKQTDALLEVNTGSADFAVLDALPAVEETDYFRHVQLEQPLKICIDGKGGKAMLKIIK